MRGLDGGWIGVRKKFTHILFSLPICLRVGEGFGYSMFSHGSLSRALDMKTPPPLSLSNDGRRGEVHPGVGVTRGNLTNAVRGCAKDVTRIKHSDILYIFFLCDFRVAVM